jgi:hypothetical protein
MCRGKGERNSATGLDQPGRLTGKPTRLRNCRRCVGALVNRNVGVLMRLRTISPWKHDACQREISDGVRYCSLHVALICRTMLHAFRPSTPEAIVDYK